VQRSSEDLRDRLIVRGGDAAGGPAGGGCCGGRRGRSGAIAGQLPGPVWGRRSRGAGAGSPVSRGGSGVAGLAGREHALVPKPSPRTTVFHELRVYRARLPKSPEQITVWGLEHGVCHGFVALSTRLSQNAHNLPAPCADGGHRWEISPTAWGISPTHRPSRSRPPRRTPRLPAARPARGQLPRHDSLPSRRFRAAQIATRSQRPPPPRRHHPQGRLRPNTA
jgi:hypothetical protein